MKYPSKYFCKFSPKLPQHFFNNAGQFFKNSLNLLLFFANYILISMTFTLFISTLISQKKNSVSDNFSHFLPDYVVEER